MGFAAPSKLVTCLCVVLDVSMCKHIKNNIYTYIYIKCTYTYVEIRRYVYIYALRINR